MFVKENADRNNNNNNNNNNNKMTKPDAPVLINFSFLAKTSFLTVKIQPLQQSLLN